jgi:hypothetical protein
MLNLVKISTDAPTPEMVPAAAARFEKLRDIVRAGSGVDFLAKCGDVLRPAGFVSSKDGVANRSWHKTGRAFDYDQESKAIVIVSEPAGGKQYFRTWLRCADQSGRQGVKRQLKDIRGNTVNAYVFDFTAAAEAVGFKRIPAWSGWQTHYNRKEFWHYQFDEGLTWDAAMQQLKSGRPAPVATVEIVGLNDRGPAVEAIQTALHITVDGVFGAKTKAAVIAFQKQHGLSPDGIVGPQTKAALIK